MSPATVGSVPWRLAPGVLSLSERRLAGGVPFRVVRLSENGAVGLAGLLGTTHIPRAGTSLRRLTDRLEGYGVLLGPSRGPVPLPPGEVTVVVPALGRADDVARLLASVPDEAEVVVVDDGSQPPLAPDLPPRANVHTVRHERPLGPAAARNAGARFAGSTWVAFVDADIVLDDQVFGRLFAHADESVVALAPRIVSGPGTGAAAALERWSGALDQGARASDVGPGRLVSYVPSAVLVVRREAFEAVGGFDEQLRVGEDVDLVWRLGEHGRVRYRPEVVCFHSPRPTIRSVLRRRYDYGTSAAHLDGRHPGRLRHVEVSIWSFAPWAIGIGVSPALGALITAASIAVAPLRFRHVLGTGPALRLATRGQVTGFAALGRWSVRPMWPLTLGLALALPGRRRRIVVAGLIGTVDLVRRWVVVDGLDPVTVQAAAKVTVAATADDLAYSAGVWSASLRQRTVGPLLPRLQGLRWPRRVRRP